MPLTEGQKVKVSHTPANSNFAYTFEVTVIALCAFNKFIGHVDGIKEEVGGILPKKVLELKGTDMAFNQDDICE